MSLRSLGTLALGLATVAAAAGSGCKRSTSTTAPAASAPARLGAEDVVTVTKTTLESGPVISGRLQPRRQAHLVAEVGGTLLETGAEIGERVRKGQLLARIGETTVADAANAARLAVRSAERAVALAEIELERAKTLAEAGGVAQRELERAQAALAADQAQLAQARAGAAGAEQQLQRTRVRAPFDGIVSARPVSVGDTVGPGAPLYTIVDPTSMRLEALVPAAHLHALQVGTDVGFTVTGFGDRIFTGTIEQVSPAVDPTTGQVRLYVDIPNVEGRLLAGLFVEGRIAAESRETLAVPVAAVDVSTEPPSVLRVREGAVERVSVELGLRDDITDRVELRSGVASGDLLVLGSARAALSAGTPVEIERL